MFVLFTDTDTDITPEVAKEYGYNVISMPYSVDDNVTYPYKDPDWKFDAHAFYQSLREGVLPNTSAISKEQYVEYFEPFFADGKDILYVHFSAAMTNTFDFMHQALEELYVKYPERKLYEIDTKGITIISLMLVYEIGDLYKAGKSLEEILKWAETEVDHYAVYFTADDLKFFHHSGRVSGLTATMGTLLGIRPLMYMSDEGKMVSIGTEKGRMKAMKRLVQYVTELGDEPAKHRIIIGNADADEMAKQLEDMLHEAIGPCEVTHVYVNPTAGSHCGPDTIGICFHSIHR